MQVSKPNEQSSVAQRKGATTPLKESVTIKCPAKNPSKRSLRAWRRQKMPAFGDQLGSYSCENSYCQHKKKCGACVSLKCVSHSNKFPDTCLKSSTVSMWIILGIWGVQRVFERRYFGHRQRMVKCRNSKLERSDIFDRREVTQSTNKAK